MSCSRIPSLPLVIVAALAVFGCSQKEEAKPRQEAVVKTITPAQPAPTVARPVTPEPVAAAPVAAPAPAPGG